MLDIEGIGRQLEKSGKADKLRKIAQSEDGRRLGGMLDAGAVERAAASGDPKAISGLLSGILSTEEGRRLAAALSEAMKD